MKLLQRFSGLLRRANKRMIDFALTFGMPRYGKRMIFVVTLFVGLGRSNVVEMSALDKLNESLGVASNTEALKFPASLSQRIWGCDDLTCVAKALDDSHVSDYQAPAAISAACDVVVSMMPKWMRYATEEKMLDDAKKVVQTTREVASYT